MKMKASPAPFFFLSPLGRGRVFEEGIYNKNFLLEKIRLVRKGGTLAG
jgi:hypothetical protein